MSDTKTLTDDAARIWAFTYCGEKRLTAPQKHEDSTKIIAKRRIANIHGSGWLLSFGFYSRNCNQATELRTGLLRSD